MQKNFATIFLYEFIPYVKSLLNHKENINFYSNDWFLVLQKYNIKNKIEVEYFESRFMRNIANNKFILSIKQSLLVS